jgi:hypothetical protein
MVGRIDVDKTYLNTREPTAIMASPEVLTEFAILPEMKIQMIL